MVGSVITLNDVEGYYKVIDKTFRNGYTHYLVCESELDEEHNDWVIKSNNNKIISISEGQLDKLIFLKRY